MPLYILANMLNNIRLELQTHSRFISGKIVMQANRKEIIMNFSVPPSDDDILVLAKDTLENLPDEFSEFCNWSNNITNIYFLSTYLSYLSTIRCMV